jgi:hypothetical protein
MSDAVEYVCASHGNIGRDVLSTELLFDAAAISAAGITPAGLPMREHICAKCAAILIDSAFGPLRERQKPQIKAVDD